MIRAIFFDIDGTLLDSATGKVPPSTLACLRALQRKGVRLWVATGRFPAMTTFLRDIFPFESHDTYDFGDFILETSEGRHNATKFSAVSPARIDDHASLDFLGSLGSLFNTNLVITTNDNLKLAFSAGGWDRIAQKR